MRAEPITTPIRDKELLFFYLKIVSTEVPKEDYFSCIYC